MAPCRVPALLLLLSQRRSLTWLDRAQSSLSLRKRGLSHDHSSSTCPYPQQTFLRISISSSILDIGNNVKPWGTIQHFPAKHAWQAAQGTFMSPVLPGRLSPGSSALPPLQTYLSTSGAGALLAISTHPLALHSRSFATLGMPDQGKPMEQQQQRQQPSLQAGASRVRSSTFDRHPDAESLWNLPNALSIARGVSGPPIAMLIIYEQWPAALVAVSVSGVTDWLDG